MTVDQVAFPQHGLLASPGTAELLEEALASGVRTIGGLDPAGADRDPIRNLDVIFALAERYGARVDIHLHDAGALGAWEIELIVERTASLGLQGRVPDAPADLVVVPARVPAEAVVTRPTRELVLKAGQIVARQGKIA